MDATGDISLYDTVRKAQAGLVPHVMHKPSIVRMSKRLEREIAGKAQPTGVLFGCFQRDRYFRQSLPVWHWLSETAETTIVFTVEAGIEPARNIVQIATGEELPIAREWAVIYSYPGGGEGLVAREIGSSVTEEERRFETIRMTDPRVVLTAAHAARDLALDRSPDLAEHLPEWFRPVQTAAA